MKSSKDIFSVHCVHLYLLSFLSSLYIPSMVTQKLDLVVGIVSECRKNPALLTS